MWAPGFCSHTILVDDGRHRRFALDLDFVTALERALVTCGGAYTYHLLTHLRRFVLSVDSVLSSAYGFYTRRIQLLHVNIYTRKRTKDI